MFLISHVLYKIREQQYILEHNVSSDVNKVSLLTLQHCCWYRKYVMRAAIRSDMHSSECSASICLVFAKLPLFFYSVFQSLCSIFTFSPLTTYIGSALRMIGANFFLFCKWNRKHFMKLAVVKNP